MGKLNLNVPNASARYRQAPEPSSRSAPRQDVRRGSDPPAAGSSKKVPPSPRRAVDNPSRTRQRSPPPNRHTDPEETLPRRKVDGTPGRIADPPQRSQKRKDGPEQEPSVPLKKSKSVDFSWDFAHSSGARPFPSDSQSCAELFRKIHYGEGRLSSVERMKESDAVTEVAQASFEVRRLNQFASQIFLECILILFFSSF
ncbi:PREDICTED: serine/arginine repetitive matrix protein 1-like [Camelina sativa]|uniref:Serine/arginine repetitive matrix protein 1-like n=1 Tax=Camelina sativa TaxID=90675 RepID=A0ABM1QSP6_CAMSA|nr:PREDICTED: serine/arginine repetitive matrix protein 1-like [Camelina sativa]